MRIVYFSHTGNCRKIANILGDHYSESPLEIKPVDSYPDDLEECSKIAKKQIEDGKNVTLEKMDLQGGEEIYLIFPSWHRRLPPPVVSFLNVYTPSKVTAIVSSYEDIGMCDLVLRGFVKDFKIVSVKEGREGETMDVLQKKGLIK